MTTKKKLALAHPSPKRLQVLKKHGFMEKKDNEAAFSDLLEVCSDANKVQEVAEALWMGPFEGVDWSDFDTVLLKEGLDDFLMQYGRRLRGAAPTSSPDQKVDKNKK
jgi:hypothetical protein